MWARPRVLGLAGCCEKASLERCLLHLVEVAGQHTTLLLDELEEADMMAAIEPSVGQVGLVQIEDHIVGRHAPQHGKWV